MLPSDLEIARLCQSIEDNPQGFDFLDDGSRTGIFYGVKRYPDIDLIVFRGSITTEDWMLDTQAEMISLPAVGLVHAGFSRNLTQIPQLSCLRPSIVAGHSLGAARAAIFSGMQLIKPIKIVLFGCPRPGAQQLADTLKGVPIWSYKNREDPITDLPFPLPDLPYVHVREFIHVDGFDEPEFLKLLPAAMPLPADHHLFNYIEGMQK